MRSRLIALYTTDRPARLTIYGCIVLLTILYGIIANVVVGRSEQEVTFEAFGIEAVLLVGLTLGYAWQAARTQRAPQRSHYEWISVVVLSLTIISVVPVMAQPSLRSALLPIPFMIGYAIVAGRQARSFAERDRLAYRIYLIGFTATIAAFASIVVRAEWSGVTDLKPLMSLMAGVLSITTVAILISTIVRARNRGTPSNDHVSSFAAIVEELARLNAGRDTSLTVSDEVIRAAAAVDELSGRLAVLTATLAEAQESAQEQKKTTEELRRTLDQFTEAVARLQESRQLNDKTI
jgi:hypothetical protein